MKFAILAIAMFSAVAMAADEKATVTNSSNVNICQPKIIVKSCGNCCKEKVRTVVKTVEKKVEVPVVVEKMVTKTVEKKVVRLKKIRNNLALLAGVGPKGNLREEYLDSHTVRYSTENGAVGALQYSHDFSADDSRLSKSLYIQGQTNRTFMLGVGLGW